MAKKFIPLWFVDIIGTEKKLDRLSADGLHMTDFNPVTGIFLFEQGQPETVRYRICRHSKKGGNIPKGLAAGGWETVCCGRKMYAVKNHDIHTENVPSYKYQRSANRVVLWSLFIVLCFILGFYSGAALAAIEKNEPIFTDPFFRPAIILIPIILIAFLYVLYANRKLAKTEAKLNLGGGKLIKTIPQENFIYSEEEEKRMLKEGTMIKKSPLGWFYAPDRAEEMVEKMAAEGWKFYRFNNLGVTFYFIKSEPCRIKFVVDYQNEATDDYFLQSKGDGWKLEFTSVSRSMSFIVWSKPYEDGGEIPEFYTDTESACKRAKRMAFTFGFPMVVMAVCAAILIPLLIFEFDGGDSTLAFVVVIYAVFALEYAYFGIKAIGYYFRVRKINKG